MRWQSVPLGLVAPAQRSERSFSPDEDVWHLNLDQIESQTGRILAKQRAPASSAGNSTFTFDEGNVLYSKLRPYLNKVVRPDEPGITTTELVPLRPVKCVLEPDFLKFYLRSDRFVAFANSVVAGAKMPRMIMDKFWDHRIPLPAPKEQRRIVELLEQADELRRKRAEADALAERILPALFLKMFGDPGVNPKEWPITPVGDLAERLTKGESPGWQGFQYQEEGPIFVTSENVLWGAIDLSKPKHIPTEFHRKLERSALRPKDVLVNLVGASIGRSCIVPEGIGEANVNQAVAVITCGAKLVSDYLGSLFLTPAAQTRLHGGKVEAARANISLNDIRRFPVPLPPVDFQERFVVVRRQTTRILEQREEAQANLSSLFNVMMHRAFTGELTPEWREAHLKELLAEMKHQVQVLSSPIEEMSFG